MQEIQPLTEIRSLRHHLAKSHFQDRTAFHSRQKLWAASGDGSLPPSPSLPHFTQIAEPMLLQNLHVGLQHCMCHTSAEEISFLGPPRSSQRMLPGCSILQTRLSPRRATAELSHLYIPTCSPQDPKRTAAHGLENTCTTNRIARGIFFQELPSFLVVNPKACHIL